MLGGSVDKSLLEGALEELRQMSPEELERMMGQSAGLVSMMGAGGSRDGLGSFDLDSLGDLASSLGNLF